MQHPPCGPGNCLSLKEKKITESSGGVCWGGETDASNPAPALTACCAAEREADVEQGLAERLLLCNSERRLVRRCKIAGRGRAPLGTRPLDVSSFELTGEGRPPCLKINK
ncbi:PREDICTED: LOW QUALITY PROTEIN: N-cym protein-like [Rhinopithecus bieti]|uniref:LOW QUALITY PROTEIN: N-cym protein-like n=1 Tax=Rhinopithecus bieti TaxID=61621 RepID=UPI00083BCBFB|nr:PREDICTED: LOW QUALITY PROTEIN: N-cym protein-like [Rhinopithecus bieti]